MRHIVAIYPGSFDPVTNGHLDLIAVPPTGRYWGLRRDAGKTGRLDKFFR